MYGPSQSLTYTTGVNVSLYIFPARYGLFICMKRRSLGRVNCCKGTGLQLVQRRSTKVRGNQSRGEGVVLDGQRQWARCRKATDSRNLPTAFIHPKNPAL